MQMQLPLVLLLLGIFRLAGAATIQRRDPHVLSVSQSGPGCPQGAPDVNVTGPWDALSFSIPAFEADVKFNRGRDQPVRCEIHVQLGGGWPGGRMLVNEVTLKGYAMTEPDTELTVWVGAYWSGTGSKRVSIVDIPSPLADP